jgi:spore coat protein U-like protein
MHKYALAPLAAGVLLALAGTAQAAPPASTTFKVSATVNPICLVQAADMAFPDYDASTAVNATSKIDVRCTNGTQFKVLLGKGLNGDFTTTRLMANGADTLEYNLYTDSARTIVWDDNESGSAFNVGTGAGMANASTQSYTVYGRVPNSANNKNAKPQTYDDTIDVTVNY